MPDNQFTGTRFECIQPNINYTLFDITSKSVCTRMFRVVINKGTLNSREYTEPVYSTIYNKKLYFDTLLHIL